jgi:glutamine amidotransferase
LIAIVNYGLGNIQALANIYKRLNIGVTIATTADELLASEKLILPGVGAFDWAMAGLNSSGMRDCLDDLVKRQKRLVLGICVGMQMMARSSDEGKLAGLGWVEGEVKKFHESGFAIKSRFPHMGWNDVSPQRVDCLFHGMESDARFYFLHSYYFLPQVVDEVIGVTDYNGYLFASAVRSGNIFGVQFHPEKSHQWGVQLLRNFAEL